jgi:signal transduction histidine kinase
MLVQKAIRDLIIGKKNFIESHGEYKQVMLSGQYALIGILLCLLYSFINIIQTQYESSTSLFVFGIVIGILIWSIILHRQGKHCRANYFLLPTMNIAVYLFASSESPKTGTFIFFISTSISAFAVFNYRQRLLSILFAVFTYVLFILAYFVDFSILPKRNYSDDILLFNVVVNFTAALPVSVMAIYLMISLNHYSALQLVSNNRLLTKTNEELDRFVYSTSHDLRAPLASVLGLIDIAGKSSSPDEVTRYLGMMKERVHSLDKFIKDITDYSRNNRLDIQREIINLHQLSTEIWETLKFAPEAQQIKFVVDIPENIEVQADKGRLVTIMSNLISNAIRYHDHKKEEKFIKLRHQINGKGFYLRIEDNGQGIAPEYQNKVFEMFFRANEKSKGSGLGLYIVKETISKLSGTIRLESTPGQGSTFVIKIPY